MKLTVCRERPDKVNSVACNIQGSMFWVDYTSNVLDQIHELPDGRPAFARHVARFVSRDCVR